MNILFQASSLKEMSAGLFDDESDDDEEGAGSDDDDDVDLDKLSVNPPVRRDNKKNERQRKKEQRRKDEVCDNPMFLNSSNPSSNTVFEVLHFMTFISYITSLISG